MLTFLRNQVQIKILSIVAKVLNFYFQIAKRQQDALFPADKSF